MGHQQTAQSCFDGAMSFVRDIETKKAYLDKVVEEGNRFEEEQAVQVQQLIQAVCDFQNEMQEYLDSWRDQLGPLRLPHRIEVALVPYDLPEFMMGGRRDSSSSDSSSSSSDSESDLDSDEFSDY